MCARASDGLLKLMIFASYRADLDFSKDRSFLASKHRRATARRRSTIHSSFCSPSSQLCVRELSRVESSSGSSGLSHLCHLLGCQPYSSDEGLPDLQVESLAWIVPCELESLQQLYDLSSL